MSGILNTKQRIMDTILTQEGKRQLASGELRLNFITFTDNVNWQLETTRRQQKLNNPAINSWGYLTQGVASDKQVNIY